MDENSAERRKKLERSIKKPFIIVFEINKELIRAPLLMKLKEFGTYLEIHSSCWIVITSLSAESILMNMREVTYPDEVIFVSEIVRGSFANYGYFPDAVKWMQEELGS
jgi:hypothetical protein